MAEKLDDAVIFADTSEWGLMHVPTRLSSPEFALLAEKDLTNRVAQRRFEEDCAALVAEARKRETTSTCGYELPALRYAQFGNLPRSCERLVREVEGQAASIFHGAVSLEDMVLNVAADWSTAGRAWLRYAENGKGVVPTKAQDRRALVRPRLRADFGAAVPEAAVLGWVTDRRNDSTHASYLYLSIVQGAGEVVFTSSPTDYGRIDLTDPDVLTASRILRECATAQRLVRWFVAETERQEVAVAPPPVA